MSAPTDVCPGHNPANLTNAQVGTAEGWRLLDDSEYSEKPPRNGSLERWEAHTWRAGWFVAYSEPGIVELQARLAASEAKAATRQSA